MTPSKFLLFSLPLLFFSPALRARDAVNAAEVNGTFTEKRTDSTFEILALGNNKLKVHYSGILPFKTPQGERTANLGEGSGIAEIQGDTATFHPEGFEKTCTITLRFTKPGELNVTQTGDSSDCGFGNRVYANGTYRKTSSKKPKFESAN